MGAQTALHTEQQKANRKVGLTRYANTAPLDPASGASDPASGASVMSSNLGGAFFILGIRKLTSTLTERRRR